MVVFICLEKDINITTTIDNVGIPDDLTVQFKINTTIECHRSVRGKEGAGQVDIRAPIKCDTACCAIPGHMDQ